MQVEVFPSAESFLFRYAEDKQWDILLLDIEMGAMGGVTIAKQVRQDNEAVQIVFISGYSDCIAPGCEVAALHYLVKPVNREKLLTVPDRALEKMQSTPHMKNVMGITVAHEHKHADTGAAGVRLVSGATGTGAHEFYRHCGYTGDKEQLNLKKKL